jgi:transcriptional regulator with XRE-family HTH domain
MALAPVRSVSFGDLLRVWRTRRRISQLELASAAEVSSRHISFLETGRARPSREMTIHLAEHLEVPLRERNALLLAAGFAPAYDESPIDSPQMTAVREAVALVLANHEPFPAIAVDRWWNAVAGNRAASLFTEGVPADLLGPPPNAYRISLHPDGLASRIRNFDEVAHFALARLRHDVAMSGDSRLVDLLREVEGYPTVRRLPPPAPPRGAVVLPVRLEHPSGELALFSTVAVFGTPADVTVAELAIEAFFPADRATAELMQELDGRRRPARDQRPQNARLPAGER